MHNILHLALCPNVSIIATGLVQSKLNPGAGSPAKEANMRTMGMTLRLNVLLALLSFGFIAAIVLGVI